MRTGDAWFSASLTKSSVHALCVCGPPGMPEGLPHCLFGSLLSPGRMRGRASRGLGSEVSPASKPGTNVCVLLPCRHQCVLFLFNVTPSL